jgi:hypothetical protein
MNRIVVSVLTRRGGDALLRQAQSPDIGRTACRSQFTLTKNSDFYSNATAQAQVRNVGAGRWSLDSWTSLELILFRMG